MTIYGFSDNDPCPICGAVRFYRIAPQGGIASWIECENGHHEDEMREEAS